MEVFDSWGPPPGGEMDWTLPTEDVDLAVREIFRNHPVGRVYVDPPYLQELIASWQEEFGKKVVHEWWTLRDIPMAAALERLETAIRSGDNFSHAGDRDVHSLVLTDHIINARVYRKRARVADPDGKHERKLIRKPVKDGFQKIDAAVSATLAYEARADVIASGKRPRRRGARVSASF
jgi:hypothetical protein